MRPFQKNSLTSRRSRATCSTRHLQSQLPALALLSPRQWPPPPPPPHTNLQLPRKVNPGLTSPATTPCHLQPRPQKTRTSRSNSRVMVPSRSPARLRTSLVTLVPCLGAILTSRLPQTWAPGTTPSSTSPPPQLPPQLPSPPTPQSTPIPPPERPLTWGHLETTHNTRYPLLCSRLPNLASPLPHLRPPPRDALLR